VADNRFFAQEPLTRRHLLRVGAAASSGAFIGLGLLGVSTQAAAAKVSKQSVNYQQSPKGQAQCGTCTFFQPPGSCSNVEGPISPSGWCNLYKARG